MERVQAGEPLALGELYDRLARRAYRTALFVCRDRECAEDAVQDAFISLWASRATYEPARGSMSDWAMAIVHYRALEVAHRRAAARERPDCASRLDEELAHDDVPTDFVARTDAEQLTGLLAVLPPSQSEVIRLGFYDGLTHGEIARRLELPTGTVKGRMRLGLNKLRSGLER